MTEAMENGAGVLIQGHQEVKETICIICVSSITDSNSLHDTSDTGSPFEWKKKLYELTKLDAAYLYLNDNNFSFCNKCKKKISYLEGLSINFENIRETLKTISTEICTAVLQANLNMGGSISGIISDDFQGWNIRRIQEMLAEKCEKSTDIQVTETPNNVIMIQLDRENGITEIPEILISQLYEDPVENDCILGHSLSNAYENFAIQIEAENPLTDANENGMSDSYNTISSVNPSISSTPIPELTDSMSLLDEGSSAYSFLQFPGLLTVTNAVEESSTKQQSSLCSQPDINQSQNESSDSSDRLNATPTDSITNKSGEAGTKAYKCPECEVSYTRRYRLTEHIKRVHNTLKTPTDSPPEKKPLIQCSQCPKTFTRPYSLKQHEKNIHGRGIYSCQKCSQSFVTEGLLEQHKTKQEGRNFGCIICKKHFAQRKSLKMHLNVHYGKEAPPLEVNCNICGLVLNTSALILEHNDTHRGDHICSVTYCQKGFTSNEQLQDHMKQHEKLIEKKSYTCDSCAAIFEDEILFKVHKASHISDIFLCDECGNSFATSALLVAHSKEHKLTGSQSQEHKCSVCGKEFRKKYNLKLHMMRHEEKKPHKCTECDHAFVQLSSLKSHMRKHTGELPFKCPYCEHNGFNYHLGLRKHLATDHKETYLQVKKYMCDVCWKNFSKESDLVKHTQIHEKNKCKLCNRQFRMRCHLNEHLLRHANFKPYQCPYCEESFLRKKSVVQHLKKFHPAHVADYETDADNSTYLVTIST